MFIFPKLVEQKNSRHNGTIKVYKSFGKYSLSVNRLTQSGGLLGPIWSQALKRATKNNRPVTSCLILGLGGGTAAQLVSKNWPQAKITGLDIDPLMVKLGKKYLNLGKIPKLKIIIADAFKFIQGKYDLILIDTYQGNKFPVAALTSKFINRISKLLTPKGLAIFNRLNWDKNDQEISSFITQLEGIFPQVDSQKVLSNTLVYCSHVKLAR